MFARMTHGIPEYNALTDKHMSQFNFFSFQSPKHLAKAGLLKPADDGSAAVAASPPRYLFYGEQPDGPASTRPTTGKRSVRYHKFKNSRKPKLKQVDSARQAAIRRCKLVPMEKDDGHRALKYSQSQADMHGGTAPAGSLGSLRHSASTRSVGRARDHGSQRAATAPARRERGHGEEEGDEQGNEEQEGDEEGDTASVYSWQSTGSGHKARYKNIVSHGTPLYAEQQRLGGVNSEYNDAHKPTAEEMASFAVRQSKLRAEEEREAAQLDHMNEQQDAITKSELVVRYGGHQPMPADTPQPIRDGVAELTKLVKQSFATRNKLSSAGCMIGASNQAVAASSATAEALISEHFRSLHHFLTEREESLKAQLRQWKADREQQCRSDSKKVEAAIEELDASKNTANHLILLAHQGVVDADAHIEAQEAASRDLTQKLEVDELYSTVASAADSGLSQVAVKFDVAESEQLAGIMGTHGKIIPPTAS